MATLTPDRFCSVAVRGHVAFDVDPDPYGDAELFERVVPFDATSSSSSPAWTRVPQVFAPGAPTPHTRTAPLGSLYQARLYPRGSIPAGQSPTAGDRPIGRLDLPCLDVEERDAGMLTRCRGDRAQLRIDAGDTWLDATLATGSQLTRMLLLVGDAVPAEQPTGQGPWPGFGDRTPLAFASSAGTARVHRLHAPPAVAVPAEEGIDPRTKVWFIALVWAADGHWDYVWADRGAGGTGTPQAVRTGTREISVKVDRITCIDDGFQDDFAIGWPGTPDPHDGAFDPLVDDTRFYLVLSGSLGGTVLDHQTYLWEDMDDGDVVVPSHLEFEWSGGAEGRGARIFLTAAGAAGSVDVPLPAGQGVRESTHHVRLDGSQLDDSPGFSADLTVTVGWTPPPSP